MKFIIMLLEPVIICSESAQLFISSKKFLQPNGHKGRWLQPVDPLEKTPKIHKSY